MGVGYSLRGFIGLQIKSNVGPRKNDGSCLLSMTHRHLKKWGTWISKKPHIFGETKGHSPETLIHWLAFHRRQSDNSSASWDQLLDTISCGSCNRPGVFLIDLNKT